MTRRRWIRALAVAGALLAVAAILGALALGPLLRSQVRTRVLAALETLPGCQADLEETGVRLLPLRITLVGLQLHCPEAGTMVVERAVATVPYRPLLAGRLEISRLEVERPEARIHGPLPTLAGGGGGTGAGRVRIGALALTGGRVDYRDEGRSLHWRAGRLDAESRRLLARDGRWEARVRLQDAAVDWAGRRLDEATATADLWFKDGVLRIADAQVKAASGGARLEGRVGPAAGERGAAPEAGVPYDFSGSATLEAETAAAWLPLPADVEPAGTLSWAGRLHGRGADWVAEGEVDATGFSLHGVRVTELRAAPVSVTPRAADLAGVRARLLSGRLEGAVRLEAPEPGGAWQATGEAAAEEIDLTGLPREWPWPAGVPRPGSRLGMSVAGGLPLSEPGAAAIDWSLVLGPNPAPAARGLLQPQGRLRGRLEGGVVALDGAGQLQVAGAQLRPWGRVGLDGSLGLSGDLVVRDLAVALERLSPHLPALEPLAAWRPAGRLAWTGRATGRLPRAILEGRGEWTGLVLSGWALGRAQGRVSATGGLLALDEVTVEGPLGLLELQAEIPLDGSGPPRARWAARTIQLEALAAGAGWPGLLQGRVTGEGQVEGGAEAPVLAGRISGQDLRLAGRRVDALELEGALGAAGMRLAAVRLAAAPGEVTASGFLPWRGEGEGSEGVEIAVARLPLALVAGWPELRGELAARGRLSGSLEAPRLIDPATYEIQEAAWRDFPPMSLAGEATQEEGRLRLTLVSPEPELDAEVLLDPSPGGLATARARLGSLDLPVPLPTPDVVLRLDGARLALEGRLGDPDSFVSQVEVEGVVLSSPGGVIEMRQPLQVTGRGRDLLLSPAAFAVGPQQIILVGSARLEDPVTYELEMTGTSDLTAWQPFTAPVEGSGNLALDVRVRGVGTDLQLSGGAELTAGYFRLPDFPHALEGVYARVELERDAVRLAEMRGNLGGGRVEGSGSIGVAGADPGRARFDLRGERVRLRYPEGVSTISNFDLRLEGTREESRLSGRVRLLQGKYVEDLEVERRIVSPLPPELPPPPGPLDQVLLDLDLVAPGNLWIDNDFARAEFQAELEVRGTAARPVLEGPVELVRAGRVTFQDVRYELVGASATFSPGFPNDPELDMQAQTKVATYTVTLDVTGRLSDMRFNLTSEPELSREEIVALLITGRALSGDEQPQVSPQALSGYLGGALAPVSRTLSRVSGIDEARIDPVFVEGQSDPTARLTLTERLSSKLSASWSTLLGSAQGDTVDLRYRILPHLELRAAREDDGSTAGEARYVRSFFTRGRRPATEGSSLDPTTEAIEVDSLLVQGAPDPPGEAALRKAMKFGPGQRVETTDLLSAAAEARWVLVQAGYRLARVRCDAAEGPQDGAPVPVTCTVEAGPHTELILEGTRGKEEARALRQAVDDAWMELITDDELAAVAEEAARTFYRERGRMRAEARADRGETGAGIQVRLEVTPGPEVRATRVVLQGVQALERERIRDHLVSAGRDLLRHRLLTPGLLQQDREAIHRLYAAAGFLDVQVPPPQVTFTSRDEATITFTVSEGPRLPLTGVQITGNKVWSEADLRARLSLPSGGYPDPEVLEQVAVDLRSLYDREGHPDASVLWRLARDAGGVQAVYEIREGPAVRVGEIRIEGHRLTQERVIRRELKLTPGEPFRRQDLFAAQKRVRDLDLFRSVVIQGETAGEEGVRHVVVRVKERDNLDLAVGAGFDDEEGLRLSFSLGNRNLMGQAGSASFQGRWSEDLRFAAVRGGLRRVAGTHLDLLGSLGVREEEREGFTERRDTLVLQLSRPWSSQTTLQGRYRIEEVTLSDIQVSPQEVVVEEGILASLGASWIRKTLDDPFNPRDGGFRSIDLSVYAEPLGSDAEFARLFLQQSKFLSLGARRLVYSISSRLGFSWPYNDTPDVPLAERFFAGGISSVRGYKQDRLGPIDPLTDKPLGGASVFVLSQELRVPLTGRMSFHVFVDGGNVFPGASDLDLGDLKFTAGPGFSIRTPAGPLRLYYGWKLDREPGEDAARFHVTFGPVF